MKSFENTNLEWIGEIPSNWNLRKIKYIFDERKEMNNPIKSKNLISLTIEKGVILHSQKKGGGNKPKEDLSKYKLVYPGDIVINSMNVIAGAVGLSNYFGVVSPVYYMLVNKDLNANKEYFNYLFRTEPFQKSLYGLGNGILIKENEETGRLNTIRMRISMEKLGDQFIPLPPIQEQKLIAQYLNQKTDQIDKLISKIAKKIEFLEEQKYAFINQYVIKGLDPNTQMKDSKVKWIGKIPKHWELTKIKYYTSFNDEVLDQKTDPNYLFNYIEVGDVSFNKGLFLKEKIYFKNSPSRARRIVKPKDVIISTVRTYLKSISIVPSIPNLICSTGFCVLRSNNKNLLPEYLSYFVKTNGFVQEVVKNSYGVSYPAINSVELTQFYLLLPPLDEQKQIIQEISKKENLITQLIEKNEKKLLLLYEYKQSLISSVVTGKVQITEDMI